MDLFITPKYMAVLFVLWVLPVTFSIFNGPVWATISLVAMFLIYAGHEWAHVWICRINNLPVKSVHLATGGETFTEFSIDDSQDKSILADVYLAGVVWDSVLFTVISLSSMVYALTERDPLSFIFSISMIFILMFNLQMPQSDWQQFKKYLRA